MPGDPPSGQLDALCAYFRAVFRLDFWLTQHLGLMQFLRSGMPPKRETDWEFNENYERDRRWVTRYASLIDYARDTLLAAEQCLYIDLGFNRTLGFNPWRNLSPRSPLDRYRDMVLDAYRKLILEVTPEDGSTIQVLVEQQEENLLGGRAQSPEKVQILEDLEGAIARTLKAPLGLELCLSRLRPFDRDYTMDENSWFHPATVRELIAMLERIIDRGCDGKQDLDRERFSAIDNALGSANGQEQRPGPFRRLLGCPPAKPVERPRDLFLDIYCALILLGERMKGTVAA